MTAIASNALTSVADVKESLGIASSDTTKDNLITRKINQASQQIANYCERVFKAADYVELVNGSQQDQLVLRQRPVNSISKVEYRMTSINTDNWITVDTQFYYCDVPETSGIVRLLFDAPGRWDRWRITYNAGYTTIPSDLAEACSILAAHFVNYASPKVNVRSIQEGQRRQDFYQGIQGFRNLMQQLGIDQIIDNYANWPLISE